MKDILAAKDARLEALELKVEELKAENQQQKLWTGALQQQIDKLTANSIPSSVYTSSIIEHQLKSVAATGIPKSCADLRYMGHSANGLYLIMGTDKVETVYCDFTALPSDPSM